MPIIRWRETEPGTQASVGYSCAAEAHRPWQAGLEAILDRR
jgi:hypothetical protein